MKYISYIITLLLLFVMACGSSPKTSEAAPAQYYPEEEIAPGAPPEEIVTGAGPEEAAPGSAWGGRQGQVRRSERNRMEPPTAGILRPGSAPPPAPVLNPVDYLLQSLRSGNIVFDSPDTLTYRQPRLIKVTLYPEHIPVPDITDEQIQDTIRMANTMGAYLTGQGFEITEVTPAVQLISGLKETSWLWDVTPIETGPKTLHLSIMAYFSPDNTAYSIQTYSKEINVTITKSTQIKMFISEHFEWVIGTLLIPFFGLLYGILRKKKE